jgi:hypothetical protein
MTLDDFVRSRQVGRHSKKLQMQRRRWTFYEAVNLQLEQELSTHWKRTLWPGRL